jgi:polyisoprenoid-binding protein YceI
LDVQKCKTIVYLSIACKTIQRQFCAIILFKQNLMALKSFKASTPKSLINWTGKKITGTHSGTIKLSDGNLDVEDGKIVGGSFDIATHSIVVTDIEDPKTNAQFAGHLFSEDFFAVDKFPTANFTIMNVIPVNGNISKIDGLLTIKGITHSLSFEASVEVQENTISAAGEIIVDRTKYGIKFGSGNFFKGLGDTLIYNDFKLDLNLVAIAN